MKIYTKTGDGGQTGLFGGARVSKADARVTAYGEIDELNSCLGLARMHPFDEGIDRLLSEIQSELFNLGAELATVPGKDAGALKVSETEIHSLEEAIDHAETELSPLKSFILPGGSPAAAHLHLCRTVCRRAERSLVGLGEQEEVRGEALRYLNRLSDLLFVLARLANHRAGIEDVPWVGREAKARP